MGTHWRRYRKKPLVIEARGPIDAPEEIETPEGTLRADVGDFVIRGIAGETYPIKARIFLETYEPVQDGED